MFGIATLQESVGFVNTLEPRQRLERSELKMLTKDKLEKLIQEYYHQCHRANINSEIIMRNTAVIRDFFNRFQDRFKESK